MPYDWLRQQKAEWWVFELRCGLCLGRDEAASDELQIKIGLENILELSSIP